MIGIEEPVRTEMGIPIDDPVAQPRLAATIFN